MFVLISMKDGAIHGSFKTKERAQVYAKSIFETEGYEEEYEIKPYGVEKTSKGDTIFYALSHEN